MGRRLVLAQPEGYFFLWGRPPHHLPETESPLWLPHDHIKTAPQSSSQLFSSLGHHMGSRRHRDGAHHCVARISDWPRRRILVRLSG